jgi:hypothetical protein
MLNIKTTKEKIFWTNHSKQKMKHYRLSDKRVLAVLRRPNRQEEGIAPGTVAAMQSTGTKKHPTELWMMYQTVKSVFQGQRIKKIKIISAWRFPGITPVGA